MRKETEGRFPAAPIGVEPDDDSPLSGADAPGVRAWRAASQKYKKRKKLCKYDSVQLSKT